MNITTNTLLGAFLLATSPLCAATQIGWWSFDAESPLARRLPALTGEDDTSTPYLITAGNTSVAKSSNTSEGTFSTLDGIVEGDSAHRSELKSHYRLYHGFTNTGTQQEPYTIVMDIRTPSSSMGKYRSLFQRDINNTKDTNIFINKSNNIGRTGNTPFAYTSFGCTGDAWYRIVISCDSNRQTLWVNGNRQSVVTHTLGSSDLSFTGDYLILMGDEDGEDETLDITNLYLFTGALTDAEIIANWSAPIGSDAAGSLLIPRNLTWGKETGDWSTALDAFNWLDFDLAETNFHDFDSVTFSDLSEIADATVNVTGTVKPGSIIFANSDTGYTLAAGSDAQITLQGVAPQITAQAGSSATIEAPLSATTMLLNSDSTLTLNQAAEQSRSFTSTLSGSGTLTKSGEGSLSFTTAQSAFSGQIRIAEGSATLNADQFFRNTAYQTAGHYPVSVGSGATLSLSGKAIAASSAAMYGANFAILEAGSILKHSGGEHLQRSRIRVDGNARLINASGYGWNLLPPAAIEVTAGTAEFSEEAPNTAGSVLVIAAGAAATDRVNFDVATGAELIVKQSLDFTLTASNTGLRKTGGGTLLFEKEGTASPGAGSGKFTCNCPIDVEGGRLTLNRTTITGSGTYTAFSGAVIGGSGTIGGTGTLVVKSGGMVEIGGLTTANLTVESGGIITLDPLNLARPITVTGTLTLPETTLVSVDAIELGGYGKICDVLTWTGEAPATRFSTVGENAASFAVGVRDGTATLYRRNGLLVSIN